jgi:hypothetical protein
MKLKFFIPLILILCFSFTSCKEDFTPFGEYKDKYALFSILSGDSTFQTALLVKSFGAGMLDPSGIKDDHFIRNAEIRIWRGDSVYFFRDSSALSGSDTIFFYFNNNFSINFNETLEIEALLPGGKRLKSTTATPKEINFLKSEVIIPPVSKDFIQINWKPADEGLFYQPRLYFRYKEAGISEIKIKEIPLRYVTQGNVVTPLFPAASARYAIAYDLDAVSKAMEEISAGVQNKQSFSIYEKLIFEVAILDGNLSRYVSSTSKSYDDLTVRVNELDYTNISGGFGIFGSYLKKEYSSLRFLPDFVFSSGYKFIKESN